MNWWTDKDWANYTTLGAAIVMVGAIVTAANGMKQTRDARIAKVKAEQQQRGTAETLEDVRTQLAHTTDRILQLTQGQLTQGRTSEDALYTQRMTIVQNLMQGYRSEHPGSGMDQLEKWPTDWLNRELTKNGYPFAVGSIKNGRIVFRLTE